MIRIFRIFLIVSFFLLISSSWATAGSDDCIKIKGKAWTNSIDEYTTVGFVRLKSKKSGQIKYKCGLLGDTDPTSIEVNGDGSMSLKIHHTIVCKDHSQMALVTSATVTWDPPPAEGSGFIRETSSIFVVRGPYAGWSGEAVISGTIDEYVLNDLVVEDAYICP